MRNLRILLGAVGSVVVLWALFGPLATVLAGSDLALLGPKERIDALNGIRGQITAVFAAIGLYFAARKYFLERDKQLTDRFNAAVDHVMSAGETGRAGGIRALGRILSDSPNDRDMTLETITGFLRHHTQDGEPDAVASRDDLSAAVAVLRKPRKTSRKIPEPPLDLRRVRLAGANLRGARLTGADLTRADLNGASLADADLDDARLGEANLARATATKAKLRNACLRLAQLPGADLTAADCTGTDFTESTLTAATLTDTVLTGADLTKCDLRGTDLSRARGLSAEQLRLALIDARTRVPDGIPHPLHT
ncbi:pentapeptide repeat-containing protein [Actinokineospora sp.]|uniref:pentapeptide repeat-containing protein n=1 Tax=Actinokineospora sp. TaxID=1872133 RepID=UPI004037B441